MSVYFKKGKGWRYDFTLTGQRFTEAWFPTKKEAQAAEAERRKEILNPKQEPLIEEPKGPNSTPMAFFELVSRRLDHVKTYNSARHYQEHRYMAKRWVRAWKGFAAAEITRDMVEQFVLKRAKVSTFTANKEIRYLRAMFNFGIKRGSISGNPAQGIDFLPVEKRVKYVPPNEDIEKVLAAADPDSRDYLVTIRETMGRMSEINRLRWEDVSLEGHYLILYTRKKKGGHLTPRKIPMTTELFRLMSRRFAERDPGKPWIFWHTYYSSKTGERIDGPYQDRKKFMKTLCRKAGVKYFRFHALRHAGASVMDSLGVPLGDIQRILGHENRSTTEIYLHSIGESERAAMAVFEAAINKSHTNSHTEHQPDVKKDLSQST